MAKISKKNLKWHEGKPLQEDFEFSWVLQEGNVDGQLKLFFTSLDIWKKNKIFGNGIKSFREDCKKFLIHKKIDYALIILIIII